MTLRVPRKLWSLLGRPISWTATDEKQPYGLMGPLALKGLYKTFKRLWKSLKPFKVFVKTYKGLGGEGKG